MNDARVRQCLLAIASLTHGLKKASEGSPTVDALAATLTDTLLTACFDLEREASAYPVRMVVLDELETAEMLSVTVDDKVIVDGEAS